MISSDLSWDTHIIRISKEANNTLGFLGRNINIQPESLKSSGYKVLVRPQLEYCSSLVSIHKFSKLKAVHVELPDGSNMTMDRLPVSLHWRRLDQRRIDHKLSLMYMIMYI